ncbi:MAG: ribonuclease HII [Candidatus Omnitrophota bacterium]
MMLKIEKALIKEGFKAIAGVDEAGRGPLAGPVVAGAVIIRDFSFPVTINDSKKMTARARSRAFDEILKRAFVGIGIIDHLRIDEFNIYQASLRAMEQAVDNLSIQPDCLLIDGPYRINNSVKNVSVIKGDSKSVSIACASIIAKVTRDRIMEKLDKLYPCYDFKNNKGYGTSLHMNLIKEFGPSPVHRLTFYPCCAKREEKKYIAKTKR